MNDLSPYMSVAFSKGKKLFILEDPNEMEIMDMEFMGFSVTGKLEGVLAVCNEDYEKLVKEHESFIDLTKEEFIQKSKETTLFSKIHVFSCQKNFHVISEEPLKMKHICFFTFKESKNQIMSIKNFKIFGNRRKVETVEVTKKKIKNSNIQNSFIMFEDSSLSIYEGLCFDEKFSDVILQIEEENFFAHKAILTTRSEVFKNMFTIGLRETRQKIVLIKGMSVDIFKKLLNFMYSESIENVEMEEILLLYRAADLYDVQTLKNSLYKMLAENLNSTNFYELYDKYINKERIDGFKKEQEKRQEFCDLAREIIQEKGNDAKKILTEAKTIMTSTENFKTKHEVDGIYYFFDRRFLEIFEYELKMAGALKPSKNEIRQLDMDLLTEKLKLLDMDATKVSIIEKQILQRLQNFWNFSKKFIQEKDNENSKKIFTSAKTIVTKTENFETDYEVDGTYFFDQEFLEIFEYELNRAKDLKSCTYYHGHLDEFLYDFDDNDFLQQKIWPGNSNCGECIEYYRCHKIDPMYAIKFHSVKETSSRKYFIYILMDDYKKNERLLDSIFYVGKGEGDWHLSHFKEAVENLKKSKKTERIHQNWENNGCVGIIQLMHQSKSKQAYAYESCLISALREQLTNKSRGHDTEILKFFSEEMKRQVAKELLEKAEKLDVQWYKQDGTDDIPDIPDYYGTEETNHAELDFRKLTSKKNQIFGLQTPDNFKHYFGYPDKFTLEKNVKNLEDLILPPNQCKYVVLNKKIVTWLPLSADNAEKSKFQDRFESLKKVISQYGFSHSEKRTQKK
eukprot:gene12769-7043_t